MSPYLESRVLQIIAHSTKTDFHYFIETNGNLLERFERLIPEEMGEKASMPAIIEKALELEKSYRLDFSFGSLRAIAESADRYITMGEMPEKALDLLTEIAPWANSKGISLVRESDVNNFVSKKTGIETGEIKIEEAEKIAHLEETLHKRVIGQNVAIESIASAIRRARSGLATPSKPLGSFLFLGPTGVGKTETSKALAESFFGDENKMIRLDMSEYNGPDAVERLIGSFAENKAGLLASKLRDNPYGVLLLDEFEKSASDVLDLFLQILDEGFFTDALGKKVNCRNLIIIATSNAGSSAIWEAVKSGKSLKEEKDKIIDGIIKSLVFKPELVNRFDGVILFEPLLDQELREIALLEIAKLQKRIKEKEIDFMVGEEVVDFLVKKGSDPQFGARSINRAVKNIIEDVVAKKMISGEVKPGGALEIKINDLDGYTD
jgi:ATP-dependent Clp protease ATP-binding subunit ClpC